MSDIPNQGYILTYYSLLQFMPLSHMSFSGLNILLYIWCVFEFCVLLPKLFNNSYIVFYLLSSANVLP